MRENVREYSGGELLKLSDIKAHPLVEGILFENDYVIIGAPPKIGKSIFVQQLTCSLSSGTPFLDTFSVPNPVKVWYFATEGKDEDTKDRLIRMSHALPIEPANIRLFCSAGFRFNTTIGEKTINNILNKYEKELPKVIIIDALYRAIRGSLKDDEVVNEFHEIVGHLADICDAAVIIVHHMKKPVYFENGAKQERSDDDIYGSTFLKASVDQLYWLDKCDKNPNDIILKCDTQRSGQAIEGLRLTLFEPDPLYFKIISVYTDEIHRITTVLAGHPEGLNLDLLMKATSIKRSTMFLALKELQDKGVIEKRGSPKHLLYALKRKS